MKKVLLAIAAVATITSCSQSEDFENPGREAEISFNSVINKSTRAAIIENDKFESFTVSGYRTTDAMTSGTQLTRGFMDDVAVSKAEGGWSQVGTFYWPATAYVSFFATSPKQTLDITKAGFPKFNYTVGETTTQVDLLAANLINQQKSDNKVTLGFRHLLTQVNFSIKGEKDFKYVISKLEVSGVSTSATYSFDGNTSTVGAWENWGTADGAYTYDITEDPKEITVTDIASVTNLDVAETSLFMLVPQTLTESAKVSITYYAIPKDKTDSLDKTFEGTKTVELGISTKWEANKKVRYTLVLSSDAKSIEIGEPTVTAWDTLEVNGGEVIPVASVTPPVE